MSKSAKAAVATVGSRVAAGVMMAWLVVVFELVVVAIVSGSRIAGVWELQYGALWLAPTALGLAAAFGSVGAGLWVLVEKSHERLWRGVLMAVLGVAAGVVGWSVGGGRLLSDPLVRTGFSCAVGMVVAGAAWPLAPQFARLMDRRPRTSAWIVATAIIALELTNRLVLVRLYPTFHIALAAGALLLAPGITTSLLQAGVLRPIRVPIQLATAAAVVACFGLALPASARLRHFDNFRLLLIDQGPLLGQAVRFSASLSPPPPIADACADAAAPCAPLPERGGGSLNWQGRDVILISIDALRADHVGAYGYERPTTPHIDALAKTGVVFEYAYAATAHTSYSVTSLMTGKYMRPLLLQGAGLDSDTWAKLLRVYGFRTAAFYPPAVFFIDRSRFTPFIESDLGFEYKKEEFAEGERRVRQVERYLESIPEGQRIFSWVHLFGPHEPYEQHDEHVFGDRDVDRYDSEIAAADATVGQLVKRFRKRDPNAVILITADHGEEFGEHGGRYHGTTVYEEQVRVPLIVNVPGADGLQKLIAEPVQTIDLLPTVLAAIDVPVPPRIRGRDLGAVISGARPPGSGIAFAETEQQTLLAQSRFRMICQRKVGACALYDLEVDPRQRSDAAVTHPEVAERMRERLRRLSASHGRFETTGLRAEGKGWPEPIIRGVSGDPDAAPEIAALLDDADRRIRRKAAELLFELEREDSAAALRLALARDEDPEVRRWSALALTRLGQGAPLAYELIHEESQDWRRLAALALAESGDDRGEAILVRWWSDSEGRDYQRSRQLLAALGSIQARDAVYPLIQSLDDVRLRPHIAEALAQIGDDGARGALANRLREERYQTARVAIADALVRLGAGPELAVPLTRFMGVPDPLPRALEYAALAEINEHVGGPDERALERLRAHSELGVAFTLVVPGGGNGKGTRLLVRARSRGPDPGELVLSAGSNLFKQNAKGERERLKKIPEIDARRSVRLEIPVSEEPQQLHVQLPSELGAEPGRSSYFVVYADRKVELHNLAVVPLADELAPPEPKPWQPERLADAETSDMDATAPQQPVYRGPR